jgi:hypothetical protein
VASELYLFRWQVPENGYEWLDARVPLDGGAAPPDRGQGQPARLLTDHFTAAGPGRGRKQALPRWREYDPLRGWGCRTLFRTFAETPPTEQGILTFANQYGGLGARCAAAVNVPAEPGLEVGIEGEPLGWWLWQLAWMRQAVRLWDAAHANDREALARLVRRKVDPDRVLYTAPPEVPPGVCHPPGEAREDLVIASTRSRRELLADLLKPRPGAPSKPGKLKRLDLSGAAQAYLNRLINSRLRGKASPMLLLDPDGGETRLRWVPHNLLGCLWLQLAETVHAGRDQWECSVCKKWFEAKRRDHRPDARHFCGTACRSLAYRARQAEARRMHEAGKPIRQIAEELGAKPEAVAGWIARQLHAEGKGVAETARELGVGEAKVRGWLRSGTRGK